MQNLQQVAKLPVGTPEGLELDSMCDACALATPTRKSFSGQCRSGLVHTDLSGETPGSLEGHKYAMTRRDGAWSTSCVPRRRR